MFEFKNQEIKIFFFEKHLRKHTFSSSSSKTISHHQLLQTTELAKAQMKFYKTKKFFCVFTYLILYKKVLKYVSKKMYSFQWKFENVFCC